MCIKFQVVLAWNLAQIYVCKAMNGLNDKIVDCARKEETVNKMPGTSESLALLARAGFKKDCLIYLFCAIEPPKCAILIIVYKNLMLLHYVLNGV